MLRVVRSGFRPRPFPEGGSRFRSAGGPRRSLQGKRSASVAIRGGLSLRPAERPCRRCGRIAGPIRCRRSSASGRNRCRESRCGPAAPCPSAACGSDRRAREPCKNRYGLFCRPWRSISSIIRPCMRFRSSRLMIPLADAPLVRDDQNAPGTVRSSGQTVEHARHELELLPAFDVIVRPKAVDDSVPVQKQRIERFAVDPFHCQNSLHNSRLARS